MNIVFLDMDGVLSTARAFAAQQHKEFPDCQIDPIAVQYINLLCEYAEAEVVISSTWRLGRTRDEFIALLNRNGFTGKLHEDWRTKQLPSSFRGDEVEEWLHRNPGVNVHVILDDDSDFYDHQPLVKTNSLDGIMQDDLRKALEILSAGDINLAQVVSREYGKYRTKLEDLEPYEALTRLANTEDNQ